MIPIRVVDYGGVIALVGPGALRPIGPAEVAVIRSLPDDLPEEEPCK